MKPILGWPRFLRAAPQLTIFSCFLFVIPRPVVSQTAGVQRLGLSPPSAHLADGFTRVVSITELADGRILIADSRERTVVVADLAGNIVTRLGREGRGPEEYSNVTPILPLGGDSSLMADAQFRRWLVFHGAEIARTVPIDAPALVATRGVALGADTSGLLLTTRAIPLEERRQAGDSTDLLLVHAATGAVHTVARLGPSATRTDVTLNQAGRADRIRFTTPILAVDEQPLLFPDGWLAVARLHPYRVDWRAPDGNWLLGTPLPFRESRLNDREKMAYRDRMVAMGLRPPPDIAEWAPTIPAYARPLFYPSLIAVPNGRLLIARTPTADRVESAYDLIDRRGEIVSQIVLPVNERIVAVGRRGVYVVVMDDDGIERVRRHHWPPG